MRKDGYREVLPGVFSPPFRTLKVRKEVSRETWYAVVIGLLAIVVTVQHFALMKLLDIVLSY